MRGRITYSTANQGNGNGCPTAAIPMRDQYISYNAMQQPDTIIENGYTATFSYYGDKSRALMRVTGPNSYQFSCNYYDQRYNHFTKTTGGTTTHKSVLWLGGSPYDAPAAMLKDYGSSTWRLVHVLRDNLGSITHVVDTAGVVLQEMGYDAWGQLRDPQTGEVYGSDAQPELLLGRGYTGHEHLPWFGLINMNARLYDPSVGRFLSPDPIVQAPDNTQNFNRYSYCLNNPLLYADPLGLILVYTACYSDDGELLHYSCELDEIVVVGKRNNASMNISLREGFIPFGKGTSYISLTCQYQIGENSYNGNDDSFFGGGRGASNGLTQLGPGVLLPQPAFNQKYDWSDILNISSSSASYLSFLMKGSKATFAWGKFKDLYELRISKSGKSKIYGTKAYNVAGLSKGLSWTSYGFDALDIGYNLWNTYDSFQRNDIESGLKYGVDATVSFISIPLGIYGVGLSLSWHYGIKDAFWFFVYSNRDNIILPEYYNGVLGTPATMPFK